MYQLLGGIVLLFPPSPEEGSLHLDKRNRNGIYFFLFFEEEKTKKNGSHLYEPLLWIKGKLSDDSVYGILHLLALHCILG